MKHTNNHTIVLLASIALFLGSIQYASAQNVEFGIRFMPTFSKFNLKSNTGTTINGQVTVGYGASAFLGVNLTDFIGIQGEVIYSSVSQKYTEVDVERNIKLKYVNIPLLLSLNTGKTRKVNLNIVAGPQIGISAGTDLEVSGGEISASQNGVLSIKKGDLGFAYGAGIDFGLNPTRTVRLGLGYRGVSGLVDISDRGNTLSTEQYYLVDRTHLRTNAVYAGLSILF